MSTIQYAIDKRSVATITLDRDAKRNAINRAMAQELLEALDRSARELARVVVLRANSSAAVWCAGHDLCELDPRTLHVDNPTLEVAAKIQAIDAPVIAMVEGHVYAGGFILLLCSDLVIAARDVQVAMTSNRMGLPLSHDLYAYWLQVMGLHRAKEMLFTAAPMTAEQALQAGLFNHVTPREQLEQTTDQVVRQILECSASGIANSKRQLNQIASQSGLSPSQLAEIHHRNAEILHHPETRARIAALLESLGGR